jgi:hypothetical protein
MNFGKQNGELYHDPHACVLGTAQYPAISACEKSMGYRPPAYRLGKIPRKKAPAEVRRVEPEA